jgi:hypothetical protein
MITRSLTIGNERPHHLVTPLVLDPLEHRQCSQNAGLFCEWPNSVAILASG